MGKLRNKIIAGLFGVLTGASFLALAQVSGPVNLQGTGGNTVQQVNIPVLGTGGTISTQGAYTVHTFIANGTFTPPAGLAQYDVLIVAGGGGGGGYRYGAGGGGAGGLRWLTNQINGSPSYAVVVGAGGTAGPATDTANGGNGVNSSFGALVATGGGGGQRGDRPGSAGSGNAGGSGGGGGSRDANNNTQTGGAGTAGQGNNGGSGTSSATDDNNRGGGGGGAGAVGGTGTGGVGGTGGAGGAGQDFSATFGTGVGASGWFAGGGGGGKRQNAVNSAGGTGGGGAGSGSGAGTAGTANTGGGGGASGGTAGALGGAGGSGIVIVRYIAPTTTYIVHTFTSSGTFTPPPGVTSVEVLAVGGGGGGGTSLGSANAGGGGGGAGGLAYNAAFAVAGATAVTVGAAGAAGDGPGVDESGSNGGNSSLGTLTALGGGGGAGGNVAGTAGGSGGGSRAAAGGAGNQPGSASGGFGNRGGNYATATTGDGASGGGGAGATGEDLTLTAGDDRGGNGGVGLQYNMNGTLTYYAGGGGGGDADGGTVGTGGQGGGGAGGRTGSPAVAGTASTGGGGGGGNHAVVGANGGSGIVIVRYRAPTLTITQQASTVVVSNFAFLQQPIVRLLDYAGNPISGINVTAAIETGTGTLGGTTTVPTDVNGYATFTNLQLIGAPGTFQLNFTAAGSAQKVVTNNIALEAYSFRIAHDGAGNVCTSETITISVVTTSGATVTNYTGTINLSTSTLAGSWAIGSGAGSLTPGSGDGTASYTFVTGDAGDVALSLFHPGAGTVDIDIVSGSIIENPAYDNSLTIIVCTDAPTLVAQQCYNTNTGNITINSSGLNSNRLLLLAVSRAGAVGGATTPTPAAPTFNSVAMTQVSTTAYSNSGGGSTSDVMTQLYMMLDASLPAGGTYAASVTALATTRICLFYYEDMAQEVPTGLAVNTAIATNNSTTITTNITTAGNNALVLSTVTAWGAVTYTGATAPLTTRLQSVNDGNSTFAVSSGVIPTASAVAASEVSDNNTGRRGHVVGSFRPAAPALNHFMITHSGSGGTCAQNAVTITAVDQYGNVLTSYTGTVTLAAGGAGDWAAGSGLGIVTNGAASDGAATYLFAAGDLGVATLAYTNPVASTVNFNVTAGSIVESPFFDPSMDLDACSFRITHAGTGSVCALTAVTITAVDSTGSTLTLYTGSVNISTSLVPGPGSAGGVWSETTAFGTLTNNSPSAGIATYQFAAGDQGEVVLYYSKTSTSTLNFNLIDSSMGMVEAPGYDPNLVISTCYFRISHSNTSDVCSIEAVTLTVVDSTGATQVGYTGTVTISTSTGIGDWTAPMSALGTLNNLGSGNATYAFHDNDNGVVVLSLTHSSTSAAVNINLNSGSFQEQAGYDPPLAVGACTVRIDFVEINAKSCEAATVTIGVYDSTGALATNYAGTVTLTTSTAHGTWLSTTGFGTLVDNNPDNGTGTYTFVAGDGGDVQFLFTDTTVEVVNINATANSGAITVDPLFDDELNVIACLPTINDSACYSNQSQANAITLLASNATLASRMVLMYVYSESLTPATGATINGAAMTLLRTQAASNLTMQVYGIMDANLPAAAGSYAAAFTGSASGPAMCIVSVTSVDQSAFPQTGAPATAGQLNGSSLQNANPISTSITTAENNSLVVSVAANGVNNSTYTSTLANTLWNTGVADASASDWAGHWGMQAAANPVTVDENAGVTPNYQVQIVLALTPSVLGPPAATGYVPVTLFQTYAGNINYRAAGNTLRTSNNATFPCAMQPIGTGSTATVLIPAGSTILEAWLYWAGSGASGDIDTQVRFGVDGMLPERPLLTADDTFFIEPNQVYNQSYPAVPESFFAAYKNVTGSISSGTTTTYRFSDLAVRTDGDWANFLTCLGGWALVVVYENPGEYLNVINLFHGFQPFWHSAFTLVPRNFRMAAPDGMTLPHGQISHITFEGDADITGVDEELELQNNPGTQTFDILTNPSNVADNQYNDTVSFPIFDVNFNFTGYSGIATSYGADVDTYFVQGDTTGEIIYPFGVLEAEQITTRYSTDQDIVLLTGEVISITNAPIADLEVFVNDVGTFTVGLQDTAKYAYTVTNNGNGAASIGFADGDVILTGNMPLGITISGIFAPGWNCSLATATAFTCVFDITTDWTVLAGAATAGKLADGETLPIVEVTIDIANETSFPLLDNDVTTIARLAHVGSYATCPVAAAGIQPDPNPASGCSKSPQFDNVNDLNKYLIDINDLNEKSGTNNNVHHNTRNVRGIETDLAITKSVVGVLEANQSAVYKLDVTNFGPDATTKTITVTDTLPAGLVPSLASGTNWICNILMQTVTCTRTLALGVGASADPITITTATMVAPAVEGFFVSNTATVSIANGNFDTTAGNNSDTDLTEVTGPLADGDERFLISVNETSTIGGVTFEDGDLVLYDPVLDTATMFLEEIDIPGTTNLGNVNALHVLPNGHIILSTDTDGATINNVTFNAEDLVLYDPILKTATLIFDGSTVFMDVVVDIDAVHVKYNNSYDPEAWELVISTAATATITAVGAMPGDLTFQDNDLVLYTMSTNEAVLLVDGAGTNVFGNASGDIGGLYIRYANANQYVIGTGDATALIGPSGQQTTIEGTELAELDLSGPVTTSPLLCDSDAPCIGLYPADFTPPSATRRLDGVHVVENGYFGHFAITSAGGDTCSATAITIRKHGGLTHVVETWYQGSIIISNNLGTGVWAKDVTANGTITTISPGVARYTFAAADMGEVILYITGTVATNSFNANITNGIGIENSPTEDSNIVISDVVTAITYGDQFSTAAYNNNDGVAGFASVWTETGDDGSATAGKIRIVTDTDELRFNNLGGGTPSIMREIDFSTYTVSLPPKLSFNWRIAGNPTGTFVVEARGNDMDMWTILQSFTAVSGSGSTVISFTEAPHNLVVSATTQIRFRIDTGYSGNASEFFFVDNVQVSTETNDCGVGDTVDHYAITHGGTMISCLAELVTITPHTISELVTAPGLGITITLNTLSGKGFWGPPTNGGGFFNAGIPGNGQATYTYLVGEEQITFPFYYTDLTSDPEVVTFSVADTNIPVKGNDMSESPTLSVSRTGLRFYNQTDANTIFPTLVAGMPSSTYPGDVLVLQAVRASDNDPAVCEAIFANNADVDVELAVECLDPGSCSNTPAVPMLVTNNGNTFNVFPDDNNGGNGPQGDVHQNMILLRFTNFGTYNAAALALNYADVGEIQLHARHNLIVEDDLGVPLASGSYMRGSSDTFVVRPFAFDIDFTDDRETNGNDTDAASWATDATGPAFFAAGDGFDTTVRSVAWQSVDDDSNLNGDVASDGVPDTGADLYDNATTPNFGNEFATTQNDVTITHTLVAPSGGAAGTLTTNTFTNFALGLESHTMAWSEVGIIDLAATLDTGNYLGGGEGVTSDLLNVGRFIPADFAVDTTMLVPRPLFTPTAAGFTYMGEEFEVWFNLTARNMVGATTLNYEGPFAFLTAPAGLSFFAIDDVAGNANDVDYSARLSVSPANGFPANFSANWAGGVIMLNGNLIFGRQTNEVEDGPLADLQIAVSVVDGDMVVDGNRNVDDDDGTTEPGTMLYNLIDEHVFRYGRLRLENAYGSEIPELDTLNNPIGRDVELRIVAEYWDGTQFVPNTLDVATPYASANLSFVGPYSDNLNAGEAVITAGVSGVIYQGATLNGNITDTPLFLQAPGAGNDGSVLVDLNLNAPGLSFLKYDWRTTGENEDIKQDGDVVTTTDNPRALIEFGRFRGNDRIIHWQEIFE